MTRLHTVLGAGGVIANELVKVLSGTPLRLVSRTPKPAPGGAETFSADVSDLNQTIAAVAGSSIVYLLVGLKYDTRTWRELWPRVMQNTIEACKRANAKLVFLDNVYMYGRVEGPMTEATPFNPCSGKGEVRARVATMLLDEIGRGSISALIARSGDFYGPHARTSIASILVFDKLAKHQRAAWLVNDAVPHSFTFTPDAARGLALLAANEHAWNQTWHLPTAPAPPTGKAFIRIAARAFETEPRYRVLSRPMLRLAGFFNRDVRESYEMLYQYDSDYVFDSAKFSRAFHFEPKSYPDGIERTARSYNGSRGQSE
jgi:nucleoside-diphosphate-sugar epimerase